MTVSNNFQPFAQRSRWQDRHHKFFFLSSHHHRCKQNYNKPALWTFPSSPQLCSLRFIMSNIGAVLLQEPKEEKAGASPSILEHCLGWGTRPLRPAHTFCRSTHQQTHSSRLVPHQCVRWEMFLQEEMKFIYWFCALRNLGINWTPSFVSRCLIQVFIEAKNTSVQAGSCQMD